MTFLYLFSFFLTAALYSQTSVSDLWEQKTLARLKQLDASWDGVLGAAAIDLTSGQVISYNGGAIFPQASSIKIPVMIQVFRDVQTGKLRMDQKVPVNVAESVSESPRFDAAAKTTGEMPLLDLVVAMMELSDNAATNKLINLVGMAQVNRTLDELRFINTRLRRKMIDIAAATRNEENVSTPMDMARLVELLYRGKVVNEAASKQMLAIMSLANADFRKTIRATVRVASKPGSLNQVKCETGIVFLHNRPFALSVASTFNRGESNPLADMIKIFFHHFEMLANSNRYGRSLQ